MKRSFWLMLIALLALGFVLVACGPADADDAGDAADDGEMVDDAGDEDMADEDMADEDMADEDMADEDMADEDMADEDMADGEQTAITFWHGYIETEEEVMSQIVADFEAANPDVAIEMLAVPFDELQNKYQTEVAAGGGPTLITGPQDRMAGYADAGLLFVMPEDLAFFDNLVEGSLEGGRVAGDLVGVPINSKVVAMFYNTSLVEAPAADFDELLAQAADVGLAITADWFHNYMWGPAFGAEFFDDDYRLVLDSEEGAAAYAYFKQVCESEGVVCDANDGDMDTLFRQGEVAYRFQGPWIAGDAISDLGEENVAVTTIPEIPGEGFPHTWNQYEMVSINVDASEEEVAAAVRFIEYLTSVDVQALLLNEANWIPVNGAVDTSGNPVVGGFLDQVPNSDPFPVVSELGATWEPMGNAMTEILEGVKEPQEALTDAAELVNTANDK